MRIKVHNGKKHTRIAATAMMAVAMTLAGCGSSSNVPDSRGPGQNGNPSVVNKQKIQEDHTSIVNSGPVADDAKVASNKWASAVKKSGKLRLGGATAATLFSVKDPATGRLVGFDAGIAQLLARYITGDSSKLDLTEVSVDTREEVLVNNAVDAVIATYSITDKRKERISFAGPYYSSSSAILVKKGNSSIHSVKDLAGKKVATQASSNGVPTLEKYAPGADIVALPDNAQCLQAVQQGRADAYVIDQTLLMSLAVKNSDVEIAGDAFGDTDDYGIGVPKDSDAVEFVNDFLQAIEKDGTWLKLWKTDIQTSVPALSDPTPPPAAKDPGKKS